VHVLLLLALVLNATGRAARPAVRPRHADRSSHDSRLPDGSWMNQQ
jgi:hypothetical protein